MATGNIELICGCMFSGKTTELIARISAQPSTRTVICLKPAIDTRYSHDDIVTHDGASLQARSVPGADAVLEAAQGADLVGIDEIHFFDHGLVALCQTLAAQGKQVICSGLDRDMWGDDFPQVAALGRIAETTVLYGTCAQCGGRANRTHRKIPLVDHNLVGGSREFEPRCESCFRPPQAPKPDSPTPGLASSF